MKKEPFVTKAQLDEIIKTYPTPFHLYDDKGNTESISDQYFKRIRMRM